MPPKSPGSATYVLSKCMAKQDQGFLIEGYGMSNELAIATRSATSILTAKTPDDHKMIDDQLSVVQDIMRRLGMDKRTQDKVGAIRVWNMRKLRRILDRDDGYRTGPKQFTRESSNFNSQSHLANQVNELGKWPLEEWLAYRREIMNKNEEVLTAHSAYNQAKFHRIATIRKRREVESTWESAEALLFNVPFQEVLPDIEAVEMIFTDPPYGREFLGLYNDLNNFADSLLPEGASLITYFGHYATQYVLNAFPDFRFWWLLCSYQPGKRRRLNGVNVYVHWKPLAWFVKGGRATSELVDDLIIVENAPKQEWHDWEQGTELASYYIEHLTEPGQWVLDPMMGSGTTGVAAIQLGRNFVGIEKDTASFATAQERIQDALEQRRIKQALA